MKPRVQFNLSAAASHMERDGRVKAAPPPTWLEKNEDQVESLKAVRASMLGQSLVNYATAPIGAKKYEASSLSR